VPGVAHFQRPVLSSACRRAGQTRLPFEFQSDAIRAARPAKDDTGVVRPAVIGPRPKTSIGDAALVAQGDSTFSPRPGAVVAMFDFLCALGAVLREYPAIQLQPRLLGDDRLLESGGDRPDSVDLHNPVHLSDDQPGRAAVLDSGNAADQA